jgi:hypothetical protein
VFQVSLPVEALPSSQDAPGKADPFATPSQSKVTSVPAQVQFERMMSLIVFAFPSLQLDPI